MIPPSLHLVKILTLSVVSFLIALGLGPIWHKVLVRLKLSKDLLRGRYPVFQSLHQKKAGTPTMGGVVFLFPIVFLALALFVVRWLAPNDPLAFLNFLGRRETYLPLGALIASAIVGGLDDVLHIHEKGPKGVGIGSREKFVIYASIALFGAWWFYFKLWRDSVTIPFFGSVDLGVLYFPYAMFIILACTLSLNEADGLDGLSSGISAIALGAFAVVGFLSGHTMLATLIGVVIGGLLGYLWYNIYPALFFMGDVGSTALGVFIGVVALLTDTSLYLPFFAPVLILESASVILQKIWKRFKGRKLFLSTPIHHHFEAIGMQEPTIVMRMWLVSALFAAVGVVIFLLNFKGA